MGAAAGELLTALAGKVGLEASRLARLNTAAAKLEAISARLEARGGRSAGSTGTFAQLATKTDEAVFWSGLGPNGKAIAAKVAAMNGGSTLEQTLRRTGTELPSYDSNNAASVAAWKQASEAFASKGKMRSKSNSCSVEETSVLNVREPPALEHTQKVTNIFAGDSTTCAETVIFKR